MSYNYGLAELYEQSESLVNPLLGEGELSGSDDDVGHSPTVADWVLANLGVDECRCYFGRLFTHNVCNGVVRFASPTARSVAGEGSTKVQLATSLINGRSAAESV